MHVPLSTPVSPRVSLGASSGVASVASASSALSIATPASLVASRLPASSSLPINRGSNGTSSDSGRTHTPSSPQVSPCSSQRCVTVHCAGATRVQPVVLVAHRADKNTLVCNDRRGTNRNRSVRRSAARVRSSGRSSTSTETSSSRPAPSRGRTVNDPGSVARPPSGRREPRMISVHNGEPPSAGDTQKCMLAATLGGRSVSTVTTTCVGSNVHDASAIEPNNAAIANRTTPASLHRYAAAGITSPSAERCTCCSAGSARRPQPAREAAPRARP